MVGISPLSLNKTKDLIFIPPFDDTSSDDNSPMNNEMDHHFPVPRKLGLRFACFATKSSY